LNYSLIKNVLKIFKKWIKSWKYGEY
jgi:hypothetical protein